VIEHLRRGLLGGNSCNGVGGRLIAQLIPIKKTLCLEKQLIRNLPRRLKERHALDVMSEIRSRFVVADHAEHTPPCGDQDENDEDTTKVTLSPSRRWRWGRRPFADRLGPHWF